MWRETGSFVTDLFSVSFHTYNSYKIVELSICFCFDSLFCCCCCCCPFEWVILKRRTPCLVIFKWIISFLTLIDLTLFRMGHGSAKRRELNEWSGTPMADMPSEQRQLAGTSSLQHGKHYIYKKKDTHRTDPQRMKAMTGTGAPNFRPFHLALEFPFFPSQFWIKTYFKDVNTTDGRGRQLVRSSRHIYVLNTP